MKKLSVVIVSYNARQYLGPCIRSVEQAMKGIDGEIIVVDNQSSDGTERGVPVHTSYIKRQGLWGVLAVIPVRVFRRH